MSVTVAYLGMTVGVAVGGAETAAGDAQAATPLNASAARNTGTDLTLRILSPNGPKDDGPPVEIRLRAPSW